MPRESGSPLGHDREAFGAELRRLRMAHGYSTGDLAKALAEVSGRPVSASAVGQWERGNWWPTIAHIRALEELLQPPSTLAHFAGLPPATMMDFEKRLRALEQELGLRRDG